MKRTHKCTYKQDLLKCGYKPTQTLCTTEYIIDYLQHPGNTPPQIWNPYMVLPFIIIIITTQTQMDIIHYISYLF